MASEIPSNTGVRQYIPIGAGRRKYSFTILENTLVLTANMKIMKENDHIVAGHFVYVY